MIPDRKKGENVLVQFGLGGGDRLFNVPGTKELSVETSPQALLQSF
jgi:hypothetical protein